MKISRRLGAILLCLLFVLVVSVSSALIVHEADHDCCGEDCPICQMIAMNADLLRLIGSVLVVLALAFLLLQGRVIRRACEGRRLHASGTLISWKIRLND